MKEEEIKSEEIMPGTYPWKQVDLIKVIRVKTEIGRGTEDDPKRDGFDYWDTEGNYLFSTDAMLCRKKFIFLDKS